MRLAWGWPFRSQARRQSGRKRCASPAYPARRKTMCNCKRSGLPRLSVVVLIGAGLVVLHGCTAGPKDAAPHAAKSSLGKDDKAKGDHNGHDQTEADAEVQAERAKLSPDDQRLVAAQEFCAVMEDSRLGAMGPPIKVLVKDQPVFVCCKGCQKKALADPDKTLAKVEELKAKAKAAKPVTP